MDWTDKGIEAAAQFAGGLVWLAFSTATVVGALEPSLTATLGGLGLMRVVTAGFRRYGIDSGATIDGIRRRVAAGAEAEYGRTGRFGIGDADAALAQSLKDCFPKRDALVAAAQDVNGFPARATELVMAELAAKHPAVFGPAGNATGIDYARTVIHASLEAAVTTPEYFAKLQPHLDLLAHQNLAKLLAFNGDVEQWQRTIDTKLDSVKDDTAATRAMLERLIASGGLARAEALGLSEKQVRHLLSEF
jgi:hypothetical protein